MFGIEDGKYSENEKILLIDLLFNIPFPLEHIFTQLYHTFLSITIPFEVVGNLFDIPPNGGS